MMHRILLTTAAIIAGYASVGLQQDMAEKHDPLRSDTLQSAKIEVIQLSQVQQGPVKKATQVHLRVRFDTEVDEFWGNPQSNVDKGDGTIY